MRRRIGAISELKGLLYWSTTNKKWQTLIVDAYSYCDLVHSRFNWTGGTLSANSSDATMPVVRVIVRAGQEKLYYNAQASMHIPDRT